MDLVRAGLDQVGKNEDEKDNQHQNHIVLKTSNSEGSGAGKYMEVYSTKCCTPSSSTACCSELSFEGESTEIQATFTR